MFARTCRQENVIDLPRNPIVEHERGASDYGKLGFGFALTTTYGLICDLGISFFIIKAVARAPARAGEMLSNALAVRISLGLPRSYSARLKATAPLQSAPISSPSVGQRRARGSRLNP